MKSKLKNISRVVIKFANSTQCLVITFLAILLPSPLLCVSSDLLQSKDKAVTNASVCLKQQYRPEYNVTNSTESNKLKSNVYEKLSKVFGYNATENNTDVILNSIGETKECIMVNYSYSLNISKILRNSTRPQRVLESIVKLKNKLEEGGKNATISLDLEDCFNVSSENSVNLRKDIQKRLPQHLGFQPEDNTTDINVTSTSKTENCTKVSFTAKIKPPDNFTNISIFDLFRIIEDFENETEYKEKIRREPRREWNSKRHNISFCLDTDFKPEFSNTSHPKTKELVNKTIEEVHKVLSNKTKLDPNITKLERLYWEENCTVLELSTNLSNIEMGNVSVEEVKERLKNLTEGGRIGEIGLKRNKSKLNNELVSNHRENSGNKTEKEMEIRHENKTDNRTDFRKRNRTKINLQTKLHLNAQFKSVYKDLNNSETKTLVNNITGFYDGLYRNHTGYIRTVVNSLSEGSVIANVSSEFNVSSGNATLEAEKLESNFTKQLKNVSIGGMAVNSSMSSASSVLNSTDEIMNQTEDNSQLVNRTGGNSWDSRQYIISLCLDTDFKPEFSNTSHPKTKELVNSTIDQIQKVLTDKTKLHSNITKLEKLYWDENCTVLELSTNLSSNEMGNVSIEDVKEKLKNLTEGGKIGDIALKKGKSKLNNELLSNRNENRTENKTGSYMENKSENKTDNRTEPLRNKEPKRVKMNTKLHMKAEFKKVYQDLNSPETKNLIKNITEFYDSIYKNHSGYIKTVVNSLSEGSIVANVTSEFNVSADSNITSEIRRLESNFTQQLQNGSVGGISLNISLSQVQSEFNATDKVTDSSVVTPSPSTTSAASSNVNNTWSTTRSSVTASSNNGINFNLMLNISLNMIYNSNYSDLSHPDSVGFIKNYTEQMNSLYGKIPGYNCTVVWSLKNGSTIVNSTSFFNSTTQASIVSAINITQQWINNGTVNGINIDKQKSSVDSAMNNNPSGTSGNWNGASNSQNRNNLTQSTERLTLKTTFPIVSKIYQAEYANPQSASYLALQKEISNSIDSIYLAPSCNMKDYYLTTTLDQVTQNGGSIKVAISILFSNQSIYLPAQTLFEASLYIDNNVISLPNSALTIMTRTASTEKFGALWETVKFTIPTTPMAVTTMRTTTQEVYTAQENMDRFYKITLPCTAGIIILILILMACTASEKSCCCRICSENPGSFKK